MLLSRKTFILLLFYSFTFTIHAQLDGVNRKEVKDELNLFFDGKVSDYYSGAIISGVSITASANGNIIAKGFSDGKGKYQLVLNFDTRYTINFSKPGYISKIITINTNGVPEDKKFKCPDMFSEITIFKPNECIKAEMLDKPIGSAKYFPDNNRIDWDMTYSMPLLASLNEMLDDCEEQRKLEEKKEKEYDKVIKSAEKAYEKKDLESAINSYKEASSILPKKEEPKNKINAIEAEIAKKIEEDKRKERGTSKIRRTKS